MATAKTMGFKWEQLFKEQFKKCLPNALLFRINNNMGNYHGVGNICDYMGFDGHRLYLIECKAHKGASIPFTAIRQAEELGDLPYTENCVAGVLLWLYERDRVLFIPVQTLRKLLDDKKKSVGIKSIEEGYIILDIPFIRKRVYPDVDYTYMQKDEFLMKKGDANVQDNAGNEG